MPVTDPSNVIGEVLGRTTKGPVDPAASGFICPFTEKDCTKRTAADKHAPYPVCTVYKSRRPPFDSSSLICVCPKRFHEANFLEDVLAHCWVGPPPAAPQIAREVKMEGFGNVDFVIAEEVDGEVKQFLSVELQAIDITGTVRPAYEALIAGQALEEKISSGLNWDNVYKRYITQLIRKGYFHHHWNTRIVAVIQDQVYKYIKNKYKFMAQKDVSDPTVNVIFMAYRFIGTPEEGYSLELASVEGASHAALQQAVLYAPPPNKAEFHSHIQSALGRG